MVICRQAVPSQTVPRDLGWIPGFLTIFNHISGVAVELAFVSKDIRDASVKKKTGEITKQEYEETVIKRVVGASVSAPMSLAGSIVGQYALPVPVIGNVVGGITGSAAGRIVGAVLSNGVIKNRERVGKLMKSFSWKRT